MKRFTHLLYSITMTALTVGSLITLYSMGYQRDLAFQSKDFSSTQAVEKSPSSQKNILKDSEEQSVLNNDPVIGQAWGLAKADAQRAWEVCKGDKSIIVAVIDTGIDVNHEDLKDNLWVNPGESGLDADGNDKATNGIDDDGNGFIDDVHGWNFVSNNNRLDDNHGHGSHVAGIIGAKGGNGVGISGVAPNVSLMILKYFDPKVPATDNLRNTVQAINYAVKMNARIINYSGGGLEYSQEEKDAIIEAQKKGILFVAAAGNERSNSDYVRYYPADYKLSNIISVTAHNPSDNVLASSNYGTETVDIAAPGETVISTLPGNRYGVMTGTSQATGFVSGAAALVLSQYPEFSAEEVKKYILATGDVVPSLLNKTGTSRRLNLYKALVKLDKGVALNGVIAANIGNFDHFDFGYSSDDKEIERIKQMKRKVVSNNNTEICSFGKNLLESVQKEVHNTN